MKMLSARFDENTVTAIDEIAENVELTRSDVMTKAVNMYIDYITWFKSEVQLGLDDVKAGRVKPQQEVEDKINKLIQSRKK